MNISDYIRENNNLKSLCTNNNDKVDIKLLSNISVHQIKPILEYTLGLRGINANVTFGEYDNIVQESISLSEKEIPIIILELSNLKNGFIFEIESMEDNFSDLFFTKVKDDLEMIFSNLSGSRLVLINKFSHILFSFNSVKQTKYEKFVNRLNKLVEDKLPQNFVLVDIDKPISKISCKESLDTRGMYLSKTFYSFSFMRSYVDFISPIFLSIYGKSKKALILDCDNTLWKGIVGEDGVMGISISETDKNGIYFKEIHFIIKKLLNEGVIIGLCSKNNIEDVFEVFDKRDDFILKSNDFVIKKVNWQPKSNNIEEIAIELNIGIDSIVFMDDSIFEINLINNVLPVVETILVPDKLYDYPLYFFNKLNLFYKNSITTEDKIRNNLYSQNMLRESEKAIYSDLEAYLKSLEIQIELNCNDVRLLDRLEQLAQKTNQFNLTTYRYTRSEFELFINSDNYDVISIEVKDKYGDMGITGICVVEYNNDSAKINLFLLSCRILGRNIEKVFLNEIINRISSKNVKLLSSNYIENSKNIQVKNFYSDNNFKLINTEGAKFEYELKLPLKAKYNDKNIKCIWKVK
jgi:FkbH-like protein